MKKEVLIGTSGYSYQHWGGVFYPSELSPKKWLAFYAQHFPIVELNVTFYRLPSQKTFQSWYRTTPGHFKFVIKGSRFITHIKRLKETQEPLTLFMERASPLKEKLLCVLWQLPPSFKQNTERLETFISLLSKYAICPYHSFEFRNESWFTQSTYELLRNNKIALCIAHSPNFPSYEVVTSPLLYLRFHGGQTLYGSQYSQKELRGWAQKASGLLKGEKKLVAFFNNDAHGYAVKNALTFKELLHEKL